MHVVVFLFLIYFDCPSFWLCRLICFLALQVHINVYRLEISSNFEFDCVNVVICYLCILVVIDWNCLTSLALYNVSSFADFQTVLLCTPWISSSYELFHSFLFKLISSLIDFSVCCFLYYCSMHCARCWNELEHRQCWQEVDFASWQFSHWL